MIHEDDEHALLHVRQLARDGGLNHVREAQGAEPGCGSGKEMPPRDGVLRRIAGVERFHVSPPKTPGRKSGDSPT
jgi:hypothetical protein